MKGETGMWKGVNIEKLPRLFDFPFPVRSIGHTVGAQLSFERQFVRTDHVEFCIRYNCLDTFITDVVDGISYDAGFPHLALKMPFVYHEFKMLNPRDAIDFSYSLEVLERLKKAKLLPTVPLTEIIIDHEMDLMMRELIELLEHTREYGVPDRIDLLCFRIVEALFFNRIKSMAEQDDSVTRKIRSIASWLQIHFMEQIDFDELAKNNGMSRCTFYRQWKKIYGYTPAEYVQHLKMEWASDMLLRTHRKVQDIAMDLQFSNIAYFCALFARYYHCTPLQFRKKSRQMDQQDHSMSKKSPNVRSIG